MAIYMYVSVVALAAVATALPHEKDLSRVIGNTICKADVHYNIDDNRIPRVIKEIKCTPEPDVMCPSLGGAGEVSCCKQSAHTGTVFSCTELKDWILVKTRDSEEQMLSVSVGCACAYQTSVTVKELS